MLASLKRFFSGPSPGRDFADVADWAKRRGHTFKRARDEGGFVIDGVLEDKPWRLEWGPPQRTYIAGRELRLRMELNLPSDMQMLLLALPLMHLLEKQTYEQFVESTQTQIGTTTPEEMRWLVMFPKVDLAALKNIKLHFAAVASLPAAGLGWVEGPLAHALEQALPTLLQGDPPFVLMTLRNRAYLRVQLADPDPQSIATALAIFETAVAQAVKAASDHTDSNSEWHGTATSAWQSLRPDDPAERKRR